jgi:hypothetical protein
VFAGAGVSSAAPAPGTCPGPQQLFTADELVDYGIAVIGLPAAEAEAAVGQIFAAVDKNGDGQVCFSTPNKNLAPHGNTTDNNANVRGAAR